MGCGDHGYLDAQSAPQFTGKHLILHYQTQT